MSEWMNCTAWTSVHWPPMFRVSVGYKIVTYARNSCLVFHLCNQSVTNSIIWILQLCDWLCNDYYTQDPYRMCNTLAHTKIHYIWWMSMYNRQHILCCQDRTKCVSNNAIQWRNRSQKLPLLASARHNKETVLAWQEHNALACNNDCI